MRDLTLNLRAQKFPRLTPGLVTGTLSFQVTVQRDGNEIYYYEEGEFDITHYPGNLSIRLKDVVNTDKIYCNAHFKKDGESITKNMVKGTPIFNPWKHTTETFNANKMDPFIDINKYTFNAPNILLRLIKIWHFDENKTQ